MKRTFLTLCVCPWLLTGMTGCADMPIRFSVSTDITAKGMEKPIRLEVGYWNVRLSGKDVKQVQPVQ